MLSPWRCTWRPWSSSALFLRRQATRSMSDFGLAANRFRFRGDRGGQHWRVGGQRGAHRAVRQQLPRGRDELVELRQPVPCHPALDLLFSSAACARSSCSPLRSFIKSVSGLQRRHPVFGGRRLRFEILHDDGPAIQRDGLFAPQPCWAGHMCRGCWCRRPSSCSTPPSRAF